MCFKTRCGYIQRIFLEPAIFCHLASCTHLALWQGKIPKVHAKQKAFKNICSQKKGKLVGYIWVYSYLPCLFSCYNAIFFLLFFRNMKVILHFPSFFGKNTLFLLLLFCIYLCTFETLKTGLNVCL